MRATGRIDLDRDLAGVNPIVPEEVEEVEM